LEGGVLNKRSQLPVQTPRRRKKEKGKKGKGEERCLRREEFGKKNGRGRPCKRIAGVFNLRTRAAFIQCEGGKVH